MTRNWKKTGYLIPDVIDPEENICVCVPIPKDWGHVNAFLGQITELAKWLTWEKDGTESAKQAARRWMAITECVMSEVNKQMSSNCGCGGADEITNERYNESGHLEVSRDGGATWENGDAYDPRFNSPVFPPYPGADGNDKKCRTANSIVRFMQDEKEKSSTVLGAAGGLAGLVVSVAAAIAGTGVGLAPAVIIALMGFVLNGIAAAGQAIFDDSFDAGFWDEFLCILYCNMGDDGSFTEAQWQTVIASTGALANYPANEWTAYMVKTMGLVGLINAGRMGNIGTQDCDECPCGDNCGYKYDIFVLEGHAYGEILERGSDYIIARSDGESYLTLIANDYNDCCWVNSIELIEGVDATGSAHENCGSEPVLPWIPTTPIGGCRSLMEFQGSPPLFTIKINFGECP